MRPVLLRWRGIEVYSYPAMLYLGLVAGIMAGNYTAKQTDLDTARVFAATLALLVPALAGARLLYVALHWDVYRREPMRIWRRSEGGAAMFGGLGLALPASLPLLRWLEVPAGPFWDVTTFTLLIGLIFARVGCLLNGCCAGRPATGWGSLRLPNAQGVWRRRMPARILEAAWGVALLGGAVLLWGRRPFPGALFLYALGGYAAGRFVLEFAREERHLLIGWVTVNHIICAGLVLLAGLAFLFLRTG